MQSIISHGTNCVIVFPYFSSFLFFLSVILLEILDESWIAISLFIRSNCIGVGVGVRLLSGETIQQSFVDDRWEEGNAGHTLQFKQFTS